MAAVPASSHSSAASTSVTLLSTATLVGAGTFDVAGIDQTYNDLILVLMVRGANAATSDNLDIRFNNDSAGNYTYNSEPIINTTLTGNVTAGAGTGTLVKIPAGTATANVFGAVEILIPGYASTNWFKVAVAHAGVAYTALAANSTVSTGMVQWASTAAITRVQLFGDSTANLGNNSQLRIYGRL